MGILHALARKSCISGHDRQAQSKAAAKFPAHRNWEFLEGKADQAIETGKMVARAVFGGGRITYHRIVGAILLYLLIAVTFATLFAFVSLSISDAFKGIVFEDDSALASSLFYLSFVTLTSNRLRDIVPVHPLARSLCNVESIIGQLYPATILARLVTLELRAGST